MSKKNIFVRIGEFIVHIFANIVFFIWSIGTRIVFFGKVIYKDPEVKKTMKKGPCIYVGNHTNHNDGFFVPHMLFGKKINVLVTSKWYYKKKYNWLFRNLHYIPIDLNDVSSDWMEIAKEKLKKGESILIFPEGMLAREGVMEPFQPGFLMLARHVEAPIIPLAITDSYKVFHRQRLIVGSEIIFDVHKKGRLSAVLREGAQICQEQVAKLLEESNATNPYLIRKEEKQ